MDSDAYARVLRQLLPRGQLWNLETGSILSKVFLACGDGLARADGRTANLVNEWDPSTALECLPDWERVLGLPDGCVTSLPDDIATRRVAAAQKYTTRGGQSRAFFIGLAAKLGFDSATITEYRPFCAGSLCGGPVYGTAWAYAFTVNLPISSSYHFHAGSTAGERLARWGNPNVECMIKRASPAHTVPLFAYS